MVAPEPSFALLHALYGKRVSMLCAGEAHMLAICSGAFAQVYSWGRGREGQLGHGTRESEAHPRTVSKFHRHSVRRAPLSLLGGGAAG